LSEKLNPLVGFWDPLGFSEMSFWGLGEEGTIGWLRQSEIKHCRVAMAAFVGYCVQSTVRWPWAMTMSGDAFPSTNLSPPEQWDSLPFEAKIQIILFVGFLEYWSELGPDDGDVHYTKGGTPGAYPSFDTVPHYVPANLYDPIGLARFTGMSKGRKERRLRCEINNGRLAMLGIMGFLSEQTIPGSVPILTGVVQPYHGEVMAPFEADFSLVDKFSFIH
jgi:hypothetical protein